MVETRVIHIVHVTLHMYSYDSMCSLVCTPINKMHTRFALLLKRNIQRFPFQHISISSTSIIRPRGNIVEITGQKIHYEKFGNGEHNILLIPGALGSARTDFSPQLENFSHQHFTIYGFDPPGYGFSRPPDRTYPKNYPNRDAEYAAKLSEILGIRKVSLIGWSEGGITALVTAANYPNLVRNLVVISTQAYIAPQDVPYWKSIRDADKLGKHQEHLASLYSEEYFRKTWAACIDAAISYENDDICKKALKNIQCPTLILHGTKDLFIPSERAHYLHQNIKGSKLVKFEEGKHNLHLEFADKFNKIVQGFLKEN